MRRPIRWIVILAVVVPAVSLVLRSTRASDAVRVAGDSFGRAPTGGSYREGEVIVQFREQTEEWAQERAMREVRPRALRRGARPGRYLVQLGPETSVGTALDRLGRMAEVDYVERNATRHKSETPRTFTPNDTYFNQLQWNLKQLGMERTWGIQAGGKRTVVVAVIDTGIAYETYLDPADGHQYVKAPDWGDVPFFPGHDFINDDDHANDDEGHGTHTASIVAEAANNHIGIAGMAYNVSLLPIKSLDETGSGSVFAVANGIDFATDFHQGDSRTRVINLSLGGDSSTETERRAVERALQAGIVVVAAAGNANRPIVDFPAALPGVIAVAATDERKQRARYSSYGPEISVVAPGGDCRRDDDHDGVPDCIWAQTMDADSIAQGRYDDFAIFGFNGTSEATPHVAALAALLVSQGFNDPASVKAAIEQTAEPLGGAPPGGRNDEYGHGLIRPAAALSGLGFNQGPD
jgi:serine protease